MLNNTDVLLRTLAILFLFMLMVGCMLVVGYEIINNQQPTPYAMAILGSGLGYAINAAGVSHGSSIVQSVTGLPNSVVNSTPTGAGGTK